ncbi:SusC/RagA family TonB-linked outer membrane protein [Dyadobacter endophyticus]|uniref:SusC/RagA family TonB-linked outer membrane protein n=1 Tax=Dyadobacter endophyticus TaxID=1749036 RepID=A0ABQ1Z0R9_9BACT|nr:SusC/RagA family TonB-linked outer membrane protein [Dyadobacter endophyticus]GGH45013.1 SusC/RagA family TonB-linked outer membrane protein [Dyadobacter endophyticus]
MKSPLLLIGVGVLLFFLEPARAQNHEVVGKVKSASDSSWLPGVTVRIAGSQSGTLTNENGEFKINARQGQTLLFSFVGFLNQSVKIPPAGTLNISLELDELSLNEVVITAGGLTAQRRELGSQATTLKSQDLTQGKPTSVAASLAGKVPGLLVMGVSSGVNPAFRLVLRGNRSLTGNNQALVIIDNMISSNDILANMNPEDIDDIQVLNGAGAAALYGSDASNGALIVTTKKGKSGKTEVRLAHTATLESVSFLPQLQSGFGSGTTPDDVPTYTPYENQQFGPEFDGSMVKIGKPLQDGSIQTIPYSAQNSRKDFWKTGLTNQTDLSVSSGDEKGSYYLSAQYTNQHSTVPYEGFKRYSVRANSTRHVYKNLTASFNTNFVATRTDISSANTSAYQNLLMSPSQVDITKYKDWENNPFANPNGYFNEYAPNPYFSLANNRNVSRQDYFQGNLELKWKILKPLTITYRSGITTRNFTGKSRSGKFTYSDYTKSISGSSKTDLPGNVGDFSGFTMQFVNDLISEFKTQLTRNVSLSSALGVTFRENSSKTLFAQANGLVLTDLYNIGNSLSNPIAGEENFKARQAGAYGEARLGFKDFLYLHVTGRNDWRSILSKTNRSFFYPSVDVSLIITDAFPALAQSGFLQTLKLRGGYSKVGQVNLGNMFNLGAYSLKSTFSQTSGYPYSSGAGFTLNDKMVAAEIKPEMTLGSEAGLDFELGPLSLSGGVTFYKTNTMNQTISVMVSTATGYQSLTTNVGEVKNEGIESYLHITPLKLPNGLEVSLSANYTFNSNKVLSLSDQADQLTLASEGSTARILAKVGSPFPLLQVTQYNRDPQGRIIVNPITGYPATDGSFHNVGITNPPHILGLNGTIKFKKLRLYALLEYRNGHFIYNSISTGYDFSGAGVRTAWYHRDRFVIPNSSYKNAEGEYVPNTNITVRSGGADFWTDATRNRGIGENYANSAGFWKLREVSLRYDLPASILSKTNFIKGVTMSVQGRNLFIWVPKSNLYTDPEYSQNGIESNAVGFTNLAQTPPARYYGATLSFTF